MPTGHELSINTLWSSTGAGPLHSAFLSAIFAFWFLHDDRGSTHGSAEHGNARTRVSHRLTSFDTTMTHDAPGKGCHSDNEIRAGIRVNQGELWSGWQRELHVLELLLRGKETVYGVLKTRIGLGPLERPEDLDLRIVPLCHAQEEAGCPCYASLLAVRQVLADLRRGLSALETLLELCRVYSNCFGMGGEVAQGSLILKESSMHLPEFSLFARAFRCLGRLEGVFVNRFQRKVAEDILQLACLDIVSLDLWQRLTDVSGAKRSLVVGKVDERELRVSVPFEGIAIDAQNNVLRFALWGGRSRSQKIFNLLELLLNCGLPLLDGLDLFPDGAQLLTGLGKRRSSTKDGQDDQYRQRCECFQGGVPPFRSFNGGKAPSSL